MAIDEVYCFECMLHKPEKCFSEKGLSRHLSICKTCEKKADNRKPSSAARLKKTARNYREGKLPNWMYS